MITSTGFKGSTCGQGSGLKVKFFSLGFKGSIGRVQRSGAHCPGCSLRGSWINCEGLKGSIDTGLTAQELRYEGFRVEGFNMCTGLRVHGP